MRGVIPKDRNWREASPRWAIDAAIEEIDALRLRAALQWPTEAKPTPAFWFGDYDRLNAGVPEERTYYAVCGRGEIDVVQFRPPTNDERIKLAALKSCRTWGNPDKIGGPFIMFYMGRIMTHDIIRGHYFTNKADARLHQLWRACEEAATVLRTAHKLYDAEKART